MKMPTARTNVSVFKVLLTFWFVSMCSLASLFGMSVAHAADEAAPKGAPTAPAAAPAPAAPAPAATAAPASSGGNESGLAAVYSDKLQGRKTASGQRYDRNKLTAAHKTLPFGTKVKVTNMKNKKTVVVRINDRGPMQAGRVLDLSPKAAKALRIPRLGMGEVEVEVLK